MKLHQHIIVLSSILMMFGMLISPGITSAWLICDPCCSEKKSIQEEITGKKIATSYARVGIHFFQALIALENSDAKTAQKAFDEFSKSVSILHNTLGQSGEEKKLKTQISRMMTSGKSLYGQIQSRGLPDISQITKLGQEWAKLQTLANQAVRQKCKSG